MARKKIKTKWVGKAEQSFVYFLLKRMYKSSLEFLPRDYKWSQEFLPRFRDITKSDILRHIERDIFNPSIRYSKYLKRSSADYKERIDNYTKYLEVKI